MSARTNVPAVPREPSAPTRVITLDGPSGSGKSTVAQAVAHHLGWRYVDTGATYRAATLAVLRAGIDPSDAPAVLVVVAALVARGGLALDTSPSRGTVLLDGQDVTAEVRTPAVTAAVSAVSAVPQVRLLLVALQRQAIGVDGAVAEGRDVGSVVAPAAAVKVYLDADAGVRARRRAADGDAGVHALATSDLVRTVAADLQRRDALDSSRASSPLRPASGAVHLDASTLTAEEVAATVLDLARAAGLLAPPGRTAEPTADRPTADRSTEEPS